MPSGDLNTGQSLGEIFVEVRAKMDQYEKDVAKIKRDTERSANRMETSFARVGKGLAAGLVAGGAFAAVTKVVNLAKESVSLAFTQARAEAKVAQAVKTTGGAAGFAAGKLNRMASELQRVTGVGDEKILNDVTSQLLTFTNISGEAFTRAQRAAVDLAEVIGSDLKSQTIQLGKALEDPVKGVGALARVGITFTDAQKDIIKGYVAQNRLMDAQNIILEEIETKYGGQAEAAAKASAGTRQLSASFGDMKERIGNALLPAIRTLTPILTNLFDNVFADGRSELEKQKSELNALVGAIVATNDKSKIRLDLIKKLNEEYPDFLGNIDGETASNEQLLARLKNVNKQLLNKILLQRADDRREEALRRQAEAYERQKGRTSGCQPGNRSICSEFWCIGRQG